MKRLLLIFFLLIIAPVSQAKVMVQLDASQVRLGQTFRLVITQDSIQGDIPDLTPLQNDFEVVGAERSTNYTIINGHAGSTNQWLIVLMPKKAGTLTIPALSVGPERTQAQTINVVQGKAFTTTPADNLQQQEVMLTASVSDPQPYVNQQVIYTIRLYNSRRLVDANYQAPQVEDALLVPLGDAQRSQTMDNGRLYEVEEQHYAIFPQKSGGLKITPPTFSALIYEAIPRPVKVSAAATMLQVKPAPVLPAGQNWFPARQVNLSEQFDRNAYHFQQGTTLIRTITIEAIGAPAQLIPKLSFNSNDKFSVYPDKAIEKNSAPQDNIIGTTIVNVTYLLNKSGKIVIPAVRLPWFNLVTGKEEVAVLPERTLNVAAVATTNEPVTTPSISLPAQNSAPTAIANPDKPKTGSDNLAWWLVGALIVIWLATLLLWRLQQRPSNKNGHKHILKQLKTACTSNQPEQARIALLRWANWQWPSAKLLNLADICSLTKNAELKKQVNDLITALYHPDKQPWDGHALWHTIANYKRDESNKQESAILPPINPS